MRGNLPGSPSGIYLSVRPERAGKSRYSPLRFRPARRVNRPPPSAPAYYSAADGSGTAFRSPLGSLLLFSSLPLYNWKVRHKALFRCGRYRSVLPSSPRSVSPGPVCDGRKYRHNQAPSASNSGRGSPSDTFWNPSFRKVPATYHIRLLWRSQAHPGMYQGSPLMPVRNFSPQGRLTDDRSCSRDRSV